jgi:hypothetical protein
VVSEREEGGYVNTKGTVNDFSVTVFGPTTTTYTAPNPPTPTVEKQETVFWIPLDPITTLNHNPVLMPIGSRSVGEGLSLSILATATDPDDGQTLTYSASGLPSGATFDPGTRHFDWTPGYSAAGTYHVTFRVFDNGFPTAAADSEDVTVTVTERNPGDNLPPVLESLTDAQGVARQRMQFRVVAHDPEGAALTYSGLSVPVGASLDPATGIFDWTPQDNQVGVHAITFIATDPGALADSESVYLVISAPGEAPPAPYACDNQVTVQNGIVDMGSIRSRWPTATRPSPCRRTHSGWKAACRGSADRRATSTSRCSTAIRTWWADRAASPTPRSSPSRTCRRAPTSGA